VYLGVSGNVQSLDTGKKKIKKNTAYLNIRLHSVGSKLFDVRPVTVLNYRVYGYNSTSVRFRNSFVPEMETCEEIMETFEHLGSSTRYITGGGVTLQTCTLVYNFCTLYCESKGHSFLGTNTQVFPYYFPNMTF
jgi:hypothetical protein